MSSVTTRAVKPEALARDNSERVTSSDTGQYNWYQRCALSPFAAATSSIDVVDAVDMTIGTLIFAAARATAISPSSWKRESTPTGPIKSGEEYLTPKSVTPRSRLLASTNIRGTIL